jgi:membrane protease YdiL (CAAX protease family)
MIKTTFAFQWNRVKSNPVTVLLIVLSSLIVLYVGHRHGAMTQAIAYLFVMWLCSFVIDLYALQRPPKNDFEVRDPKRETMYFVLCLIGFLLFAFFRASGVLDWDHTQGFIKLGVATLIVFVYPIALAVIFLLLKYKPSDLGIRFQGLLIALPIIALCALTNRLVSPKSLTWDSLLAESGGIVGALLSGFILAGLSEEFFRVIGQTRLGALFNNKGLGWFLTTVIWALFHIPMWYVQAHDLTEALLGAMRIIPLGLMWGYLTHRTKSILPSVLVHGMNVWGLQNF